MELREVDVQRTQKTQINAVANYSFVTSQVSIQYSRYFLQNVSDSCAFPLYKYYQLVHKGKQLVAPVR